MPVRDLEELAPDTRRVVKEYLAALEAGFCGVPEEVARDATEESRTHFLDTLSTGSSPDDAEEIVRELGEPEEYAIALCEAIEDGRAPAPEEGGETGPMGRVLGIPYDASVPTPEKVRSRMWNPQDPRIFMPRFVGLGWTINFGALAVRVGLIEPDSEDQPFDSVPESWLLGALAVPVLITAAMVLALVLLGGSLPSELPVHWGLDGSPDDFASSLAALGAPLALTLAATAYAIWAFVTRTSRAARAVPSAFAAMFAALAATIFAASLAWGRGIALGWWWPWVMVALTLLVPFVMLVTLARRGRSEEIRRDRESA